MSESLHTCSPASAELLGSHLVLERCSTSGISESRDRRQSGLSKLEFADEGKNVCIGTDGSFSRLTGLQSAIWLADVTSQ